MTVVLAEFEDRVTEVEAFFRLLTLLDEDDIAIHRASKRTHKIKAIDESCFKTIKASCFLILYNLIEASIRSCFSMLYDQIKSEGLEVAAVNQKFRELWVRQKHLTLDGYSASPRNYEELATEIVAALVEQTVIGLDPAKLPVSGNLDADEVRRLCHKHGISPQVHYKARGGTELKTIRKQRNALAHGNSSFSEVGRQFTVEDLLRMKQQTIVFTRSIIRSVIRFVEKKGYTA